MIVLILGAVVVAGRWKSTIPTSIGQYPLHDLVLYAGVVLVSVLLLIWVVRSVARGWYSKLVLLVGTIVLGWLAFGNANWPLAQLPNQLPRSGGEMFALAWSNLLVVLVVWAIVAIFFAILGYFNLWGAKVVATMQTIVAVGVVILIVGGALVALGTWMSSGTSSHSAATTTNVPPPAIHTVVVPPSGQSDHFTVPSERVVDRRTIPEGVKLKCLMGGRVYTAWEDWPTDASGRYTGVYIDYCYFLNLQNRPVTVQYRFVLPS